MPFARVVAYFVKGQHGGLESENKQECSIPALESRSVLRTAPISDSAVQPEPSGVYSSCPGLKRTASTNDFCTDHFINLAKAHLMKVYDSGHRDLHTSYDTAEGSESMRCYLLSFGFSSAAKGTSLSKSLHAKYINFILQDRRHILCKTTPSKTFHH